MLAVQALLLLHFIAADDYVKVVNGRCGEFRGVYPMGQVGSNWTSDLDLVAKRWCSRRSWCVGFMRYIAEEHCEEWCGRPQFCKEIRLEPSEDWVSYVQLNALRQVQEERILEDEALPLWAKPETIHCPKPYRGVVQLWRQVPPQTALELNYFGAFTACRVLLGEPPEGPGGFFQGVLSSQMPFFSAETQREPWVYHFDSLDYFGETLVGGHTTIGPKRHYLSMFYTSPNAFCDGQNESQWSFEAASQALPGHVYLEDGRLETRRQAFLAYHFSAICVEHSRPLPQALVDAIGFGSHPLVPTALHASLQKVFFHLPDAAQPFSRLHPKVLEKYLEHMYHAPEQNEVMYYKQTFLFLLMELFRYRYRQDQGTRLRSHACALCHDQLRDPRAVAYAFCIMSRRTGGALRSAIRRTWAQSIGEASSLRFFVGKAEEPMEEAEDLVELEVPEAYSAVTLKAMSMLRWAQLHFPELRYIIRSDDDVYLRPQLLVRQLERRPAVGYLWGNFDSGSTVVRDPSHPHYNSKEQLPPREHPMMGDIWPPYVRGHLWAMSRDLLSTVCEAWEEQLEGLQGYAGALTERLPHPDDPALGVIIAHLVDQARVSVAIDDRDLNHFAMNPSCNATFMRIHNRTWVVHHVTPLVMDCMWALDAATSGSLADLCPCSMEVVEEKSGNSDDDDFDYPRERFNE